MRKLCVSVGLVACVLASALGCKDRARSAPDEPSGVATSARQVEATEPTVAPTETDKTGRPTRSPPSISESDTAAQGDTVDWILFTTSGADPEAKLPWIVGIHGLGDRPEAFAGLFRRLPFVVHVVLPRGLLAYKHGGFDWFGARVRGDPERLADGVQRATARLAELLRELGEQERFVGKPVVTGFSQGGILSYSLAVHHPELISASVPIAGWLPPRIAPDSPPRVRVPIVALHGEEDRVVPFIQTHELASEMASLGFDLQLQTYPRVAHSINREVRDDWVRALTRLIARHEAHQ